MSRKFLTPKDEYAVSRTVKAFRALTVLQTHALRIYNRGYLETGRTYIIFNKTSLTH